ncbi:solute carrier family 23 protein [Paenibacillus sp. FSL E2-8871]|uniref:uracil-xanthine permease family protein n=1 Tax=unclassified Paenibacillus TaxID=185978 RepID=UPI0004F787A3|nr:MULTISPECIES: solute carrier family 23 protein [unclassified Paenibacillus]AIQ21582.1 xanthine/uracil permease [Paenibacillus sp. FSL H7-0737]KAA1184267.1 purine permease [Paenibacillus sp. B2(2019)]
METQANVQDQAPLKSQLLTVLPDEKVSFGKSIILGFQHVLAMDVYVVPFLIAMLIGLQPNQSSALIQSTFIAAGLATIVQTYFCMKLPIAQGPSYVPLGAIVSIYAASGGGELGWSSVLGASLIGAVLVIILGYVGIFNKIVKNFIPPIVGGTIIFIVGLSLLPVAIRDNIYGASGASINQNVLLALISAGTLLLFVILGSMFRNKGSIFRIISVMMALVVGCISANLMGVLDFSAISKANWFSMPRIAFVDFGFSFNFSAIITMVIIYLVLLAETTGTWFAVSNVINKPLTDEHINKGVIGEGIGCLIASALGSTPVTGYSTNAGIISITGVASRRVFLAVGGWFVLFGCSGKLAALISSIPSAVIGGVFAIVCGIIAINGVQVMKNVTIGEKEMYIIAIPMIITLALVLIPGDYLHSLPSFVQYLLGSPILAASLAAILLNKLLPSGK